MDFGFIRPLTVVVGHYGAGKTNFAVNLALALKAREPDRAVRIADFDMVNPYFRTADAADMLRRGGVEPLLPAFANTNVDTPSLPPRLASLIGEEDGYTIVDVGGDDGSVALGMYRERMKEAGYAMLCVVNRYRPLIEDPAAALDCMRQIEEAAGLCCTAIVNDSNLGAETTAEDVLAGISYGKACASLAALPLLCHCYFPDLAPDTPALLAAHGMEDEPLFPMTNATRKLF